MFLPRVLRPLPAEPVTDERVQRSSQVPFSVLAGPMGDHVAERLAGTIVSWDRWDGCVWFRAGGLRRRALARGLADACGHRWGADNDRQESPPASVNLRGLLSRAPAEAVVVVEMDARAVRGTRRLVADLRPALVERRTSLLVVTESPWRRGRVPGSGLPDPSCDLGSGVLPATCRENLWRLARRSAVSHDVLGAAQTWGTDVVSSVVDGARTLRSLLDGLTERLLDLCDAGEVAALQMCVEAGYWHTRLTTPALAAGRLRPWVVPLEEGWCWLRPIWRDPLRRQLARSLRREDRPPGGSARPARRGPPAARPAVLQVRLLGEFEVRVDGRAVTAWQGRRGRSILQFLLARPRRACSRDELLATFWPEVTPEVARNRLQVAVSGLRKAFGKVTGVNVVEYAGGSYRINPALALDVDVDRFEGAVAAAREARRGSDTDGALVAYREAVACYRGDFAVEAASQSWTLVPRENLRIAHLDALAGIAHAEFARGAHDECIAAAQRMLEADPCREDAHRLLMRSYLRQGRTYQAHRQYDFCRKVLRSTLGVEPAPDTTQVYDDVRAGRDAGPALTGWRGRTR
jgi:DNA-binding SARP family transcriptional activator